jgi:hypothetical protein
VYALKALIANLLAVKGLTGLRAGLRAHVKGLIIIIDLICKLLRSPQSHLLATSLNVLVLRKYLHHPIIEMFVFIYLHQHLLNSDSALISTGSSCKGHLSRPPKSFASVAGFQAVAQPFPMDSELNFSFFSKRQIEFHMKNVKP